MFFYRYVLILQRTLLKILTSIGYFLISPTDSNILFCHSSAYPPTSGFDGGAQQCYLVLWTNWAHPPKHLII